jgi:hypothetical protein
MEQKAVSGGGVSNPSRRVTWSSAWSQNRRQDEEEKEEEKKNRN